ncbi:MAG: LysM peptidoglycan-binding domain-containing protein [Spirochaetaceae bacterium]|jgi:tetratricopeptide (TPR) repeat protein|nr:LysM peptidoglycan-binding domain-containing protein [Spirochaetaceae bacterium]
MNNKSKNLLLGAMLLLRFGTAALTAVEGTFQPSDFVNSLINNQYLLESIRLTRLAEECYGQGEYDEAIRYAEEALKYAQWSDMYVTLQMKIKGANDAITAAQKRLDWAAAAGALQRYAEVYAAAQNTYEDALIARSGEEWDKARETALRVIALLSAVQELPALPAQYLVQSWDLLRDCLWNIAAKPQIYGDPFKWTVIYEANKEKLSEPANPDLIHPGFVLDIPSISGEIREGLWVETLPLQR